MENKKCCRCDKGNPEVEFHKGNQSYCIPCRRVRRQLRRLEGKRKPSNISKFRKFTDIEIIILINTMTLKEVGEIYGISPSQISAESAKRKLFRTVAFGRKRNVSIVPVIDVLPTKEEDLYMVNDWMNSPERKYLVNSGLMSNKSLKYE